MKKEQNFDWLRTIVVLILLWMLSHGIMGLHEFTEMQVTNERINSWVEIPTQDAYDELRNQPFIAQFSFEYGGKSYTQVGISPFPDLNKALRKTNVEYDYVDRLREGGTVAYVNPLNPNEASIVRGYSSHLFVNAVRDASFLLVFSLLPMYLVFRPRRRELDLIPE